MRAGCDFGAERGGELETTNRPRSDRPAIEDLSANTSSDQSGAMQTSSFADSSFGLIISTEQVMAERKRTLSVAFNSLLRSGESRGARGTPPLLEQLPIGQQRAHFLAMEILEMVGAAQNRLHRRRPNYACADCRRCS